MYLLFFKRARTARNVLAINSNTRCAHGRLLMIERAVFDRERCSSLFVCIRAAR